MLDESEVGRVSEGMPLSVVIAAWPDDTLPGTLEHIAPKGQDVAGAIQFGIRAAVDLSAVGDRFVRAGLSANADIVLDQRTDVLSISESLLRFEDGQPLVEVATEAEARLRPRPERRIHVEVLDGVVQTHRRPWADLPPCGYRPRSIEVYTHPGDGQRARRGRVDRSCHQSDRRRHRDREAGR